MKIYKTLFDKNDTPFRQDFQPDKKYHTVWKNLPYTKFLGHTPHKVLLFGIFKVRSKKFTDTQILFNFLDRLKPKESKDEKMD